MGRAEDPKSPSDTVLETKAEPWAHAAEVKPGWRNDEEPGSGGKAGPIGAEGV